MGIGEGTSRADSQRREATAESRASRTARGQRQVDCRPEMAAALRETPETAASVRRTRASASSGGSASGADEGSLRPRPPPRAITTNGLRVARRGGDAVVPGQCAGGEFMRDRDKVQR